MSQRCERRGHSGRERPLRALPLIVLGAAIAFGGTALAEEADDAPEAPTAPEGGTTPAADEQSEAETEASGAETNGAETSEAESAEGAVESPFGEPRGTAPDAPAQIDSGEAPAAAPSGQAPPGAAAQGPGVRLGEPETLREPLSTPPRMVPMDHSAETGRVEVVSEGRLEPRPWHIRASGGANELFARHESLDSLRSDDVINLAAVTLEAEWDLFGVMPLVFQAGYGYASWEDTLFSDLETSTDLHTMSLGLLAGYRLWDAFMPFVRGGFVGTWANVTIAGAQTTLADWSFGAGGYAFAGVELSLPRRWIRAGFRTAEFTIGFRVEAGYLFLGELEVEATNDDEDTLIDHRAASLGTLRLDGAAFNIAGVISF